MRRSSYEGGSWLSSSSLCAVCAAFSPRVSRACAHSGSLRLVKLVRVREVRLGRNSLCSATTRSRDLTRAWTVTSDVSSHDDEAHLLRPLLLQSLEIEAGGEQRGEAPQHQGEHQEPAHPGGGLAIMGSEVLRRSWRMAEGRRETMTLNFKSYHYLAAT